jgi:hypothetical protein
MFKKTLEWKTWMEWKTCQQRKSLRCASFPSSSCHLPEFLFFPILQKSSIYRGVSRAGYRWGAKYNMKRIKSTCGTEQEAARLYDEYLRQHQPEKYLKVLCYSPFLKASLFPFLLLLHIDLNLPPPPFSTVGELLSHL